MARQLEFYKDQYEKNELSKENAVEQERPNTSAKNITNENEDD
jgi:hypothetical protein